MQALGQCPACCRRRPGWRLRGWPRLNPGRPGRAGCRCVTRRATTTTPRWRRRTTAPGCGRATPRCRRCTAGRCRSTRRPTSAVQESQDVFRNGVYGFGHSRVHDTLDGDQPLPGAAPRCRRCWTRHRARPGEETVLRHALPRRRHPARGGGIRAAQPLRAAALRGWRPTRRTLFTPGRPLLAAALGLMSHVHRQYGLPCRRPPTWPPTRCRRWPQGQGVCQDFAHLRSPRLRALGLPARYVSGYLVTHPPPGQPKLQGSDATTPGLEVWCPMHGWVAAGPDQRRDGRPGTMSPLAWGRDYADVAPLRGVIRGGGLAPPVVGVTVEPV